MVCVGKHAVMCRGPFVCAQVSMLTIRNILIFIYIEKLLKGVDKHVVYRTINLLRIQLLSTSTLTINQCTL